MSNCRCPEIRNDDPHDDKYRCVLCGAEFVPAIQLETVTKTLEHQDHYRSQCEALESRLDSALSLLTKIRDKVAEQGVRPTDDPHKKQWPLPLGLYIQVCKLTQGRAIEGQKECGKRHTDAPQPFKCAREPGHDGACVGPAISVERQELCGSTTTSDIDSAPVSCSLPAGHSGRHVGELPDGRVEWRQEPCATCDGPNGTHAPGCPEAAASERQEPSTQLREHSNWCTYLATNYLKLCDCGALDSDRKGP